MATYIYPSSSVFSTLLSASSLLDISSFPHNINLETKFPIYFTSRPTKVCSHSMQLCLHMRQHESTFIDIACISGTNLRHSQDPGSPQAHRHWHIPRPPALHLHVIRLYIVPPTSGHTRPLLLFGQLSLYQKLIKPEQLR